MLTFNRTNTFLFACLLTLNLLHFVTHVSGWWYLVLGLVYMLIINIGSFRVDSNFHFPVICKNPTVKDGVVLSFDDGPDAETTPLVLDVLKKHNAKAVFFLIGKKAEEQPELVKRIIQEGHTLANHTYGHSYYFDFFPAFKMLKEFMKSQAVIFDITGKKIRWFRPPYGVTNPMMKKALKKSGFIPIGWSVRSLDTVIKDPDGVMDRMKKTKGGDILLMHDIRKDMPAIVERILIMLAEKKLQVVLPEIIIGTPPYLEDTSAETAIN